MTFMFSKPKAKAKKKQIRPGTYMAIVTNVVWSPGYCEGEAVDVSYDVQTNKNDPAVITAYSERFQIHNTNERTQQFHALLDEINAKAYADFIGTKLKVTFEKKSNQDGYYFSSITKHVLVKGGEVDADHS